MQFDVRLSFLVYMKNPLLKLFQYSRYWKGNKYIEVMLRSATPEILIEKEGGSAYVLLATIVCNLCGFVMLKCIFCYQHIPVFTLSKESVVA
jgi:hypothetical protein